MTKSKAVKTLKEQIKKLENDSSYKYDGWLRQTKTLIKEIFGEESEEFRFINSFGFSYYSPEIKGGQKNVDSIKIQIENIIKYLLTCIETVKQIGIKTQDKNFLSNFKNPDIVGISITIGVIIFSIGYYFGYEKGDKQNIEIRQELKTCQDSLKTIGITFNIHKNNLR